MSYITSLALFLIHKWEMLTVLSIELLWRLKHDNVHEAISTYFRTWVQAELGSGAENLAVNSHGPGASGLGFLFKEAVKRQPLSWEGIARKSHILCPGMASKLMLKVAPEEGKQVENISPITPYKLETIS